MPPWEKYGAPAQSANPFVVPPDPARVAQQQAEEARRRAAEARAQQDQKMQSERFAWERGRAGQQDNKPPSGYRWGASGNLEAIPGGPADLTKNGRALRQGDSDKLRASVDQFSDMARVRDSFVDDFGGAPFGLGTIENAAQGVYSGIGTPGQRDWWSDLTAMDNLIRNDLFGASLTQGEKQAYSRTTVSEGMDPKEITRNLERREDIMRGALTRYVNGLKAGGWSEPEINALVGDQMGRLFPTQAPQGAQERRDDPVAIIGAQGSQAAPGGPAAGLTPPPFSPGNPGFQRATGNQRTLDDPESAAAVDRLIRSGASIDQINAFAQSKGLMPVNPQEYQAVREYLRKNPGYKGSLVNAKKYEPLSAFEKGVTAIGDNPMGAYALGAGQFLSGNTLDNMAPDPERARLAMGIQGAQNPTATTLGEISGGIMAGLTGEAGLARLGMAPTIGRGVAADAAMGAANGAGAADTGNRFGGAMQGGLAAGVGSLAGAGAARGASRVIGATGGKQAPLYAAGVRPTLGQRVADKGILGRAVNAGEQALQSVPLIGSAIQGARQEARDQFQLGAFNEALKEVGEELPKGLRPGTDPHAYSQNVFNRVYDEARSGMKLVVDEELANDLSTLSPDIATLGPQASSKLDSIIRNVIEPRMPNGRMEGANYKATTSDLGKHIARLRKGQLSEDQALADVLEGVQRSLDNAARRYSDPEAVQLLDAADAGYAKLVRIEGAAARRGGDDGTFSPKQFSSEVQKAGGGVRSKSFLRGDALMQDYANAGRTLDDTLPNSGTVDRALVGGGLLGGTGLGVVPPPALAALGGIGLAYAPKLRKGMQEVLKPAGPKRNAIAERLRKRARLIGTAGGSTVGALLLGTNPSQ